MVRKHRAVTTRTNTLTKECLKSHASFTDLLAALGAYKTGLANQAMDSERSWLTTSDDDHTSQLDFRDFITRAT